MIQHISRYLSLALTVSLLSSCIVMSDNDFGELFRPSIQNAAMDGNMNEVKKFLQDGVDVNAVDKEGDSALIVASRWGYLDVVSLLIQEGADPNQQNIASESALGEALVFDRKKDVQLVGELIKAGADIETQDEDGYTPLHTLAYNGHHRAPSIARTLLAQGANPNSLTQGGQDALMLALDNRDDNAASEALILLLIEHISDGDLRDSDGWLYLDFLCDGSASFQSYDLEIAKRLVSAGNTVGEDAIEACESNEQQALTNYLKKQ